MNDSVTRIQTMKQTIVDHHNDGLRRAAHSLKGSSSNVGARRLAELCGVMESLAAAGDSQAWQLQLEFIETELMEVIQLLK
jgi:HPt (histidine-containing phosphotransfer) domain-containing protein